MFRYLPRIIIICICFMSVIHHVVAGESAPRRRPDTELIQVVTVEIDGFRRWLNKNPMPEQPFHIWQSFNGKHSIEAQLVSVKNDEITLRTRNERDLTVSRWELSDQTKFMLEREAIPEVAAFKRAFKEWERTAHSQRQRVQYTL